MAISLRSASVLAGACVCALCACQGDDDDSSAQPVTLQFDALVGGEPADCGTTYTNVGIADSSVQLGDARMFVSGVEARDGSGNWTALSLDDTAPWQGNGVALLDFEDGSGSCSESGTSETNRVITGSLPAGDYSGLRFVIGVPFEQNHLDGATVQAPLDSPGMYWSWQSGFKFLRVDFLLADATRWNVHIGSTQCASASPVTAPASECGRVNASTIELDAFNFDSDSIALDLRALVASADLSQNTSNTAPGCMSQPDEAGDCTPTYAALGLAFDTGACTDACSGQRVFSARSRL
jgi:uncharacterized repeat protein (TIGR04052 family)